MPSLGLSLPGVCAGGDFESIAPAWGVYVVLALLLVFVAAANPVAYVLGVDPYETDLLSQYSPPSPEHPLGTDDAGRDELVRLMLGGQISLLVGVLSTLAGSIIGLTVGVVSGYFGKRVDALLMRFTDGMIALPLLPLLIVLGAIDLTKLGFSAEFAHSGAAGFWRVVIIVALVDWTGIARLTRAATLALRERDYVRSARASGGRASYIMTAHILPNVATPLIVAVTLTIGRVILFEVGAELPGVRHRGAHAELGQYAQQRAGTRDHGASVGDLPRTADFYDCHRRQFSRRRPAACVRSAFRTVIAR